MVGCVSLSRLSRYFAEKLFVDVIHFEEQKSPTMMEAERKYRQRDRNRNGQGKGEKLPGDEKRPLTDGNADGEKGTKKKRHQSRRQRAMKKHNNEADSKRNTGNEENENNTNGNTENANANKQWTKRRRPRRPPPIRNEEQKQSNGPKVNPEQENNEYTPNPKEQGDNNPKETEKAFEGRPPRRRRYRQPPKNRDQKQRIPAMNLVSSFRQKFNIIHYQPPPYTSLPPRCCDQTKMTTLRLKNVDSGVDESLLFWTFKQFGWIENVYVVRSSFGGRQWGVAFVCFRSDTDAAYVISQSGTVQLFGRRISIQLYASRQRKKRIFELPDRLLARIFSYLDWRSRIRSEAVCRKFHNVLTQMYPDSPFCITLGITGKEPWVGFPDGITIIFVMKESDKAAENTGPDVLKVVVSSEDAAEFNEILRSVLLKFSSNVVGLEIHGFTLNQVSIGILNGGGGLRSTPRWDAGRILLKDCVLSEIELFDIVEFYKYYGDRLSLQ